MTNDTNADYAPYPSKIVRIILSSQWTIAHSIFFFSQMMLLDIIDNLPRLRMSTSQFKMILWILKECGVKNTPSNAAFRKMQHELKVLCGSEPKAHVSSLGNLFYVNDMRESIARVCMLALVLTAFLINQM